MATFTPSKYQQAIFTWIKTGKGSAIVEAVAGSGKTSTVVKALELIPPTQKALFLAFNKSIADELKLRVPVGTIAATFHSAGFRAWKARYKGCQLDDHKVWNICRDMMGQDTQMFGAYVSAMVSLAKQNGVGCLIGDSPEIWSGLADHYDVRLDVREANGSYRELEAVAINMCRKVLAESNNRAEYVVDFDDMIYMPVKENLRLEQYDWVFVDEAQDTNRVRLEMAARMVKPVTGRFVAVGDSHQAIYGFTGANSDSMAFIKAKFDCKEFPLSISYRCAKSIVAAAKQYVPYIEASETAPEGLVEWTTFDKTTPDRKDAILCRNNAPLVQLAYDFIARGIGCKIIGRDIGKGLIKLIDRMQASNLKTLVVSLDEYVKAETTRLALKHQETRAQAISDKVTCIQTIICHLKSGACVEDLKTQIDTIFGETTTGLLSLSTVHKAKGLEWDTVFIYKPELMPCKWAKQQWQFEQEVNLQYVAVTRAKKALYFVKGEDK